LSTIWLDLTLAWRNIVRHRRHSAIAIGAVSFGITALIVASGFIEWSFMDFRESTINSQLGTLRLSSELSRIAQGLSS
jgi:putative ABC transport system permease protein